MSRRFNTAAIAALPVAVLAGLVALAVADSPRSLGGFTTTLVGRSPEQVANIRRAAGLLDGARVRSREEFSFNETVGETSTERGFLQAPSIIEGKLDESPGGGICQVSSTLYNAALLAGLEIVERHPHSYPVRSVPPGRDATVVFGDSDLKFRNNLPDAVTISARVSGNRLVIELLGKKRSDAQARLVVETDESPRTGDSRYVTATVWREEVLDGRVIRREFVSSDRYQREALDERP